MKLLITGGAGFIGSNFVHYWVGKYSNDKVKVLDLLTYAGNINNLKDVKKKIEFVKGDIVDRGVARKVMEGVDVVVHFAAESHVDKSVLNPTSFTRTNVKGTLVLLEEAEKAKVKRFHHISTDEVYGELPLDSNAKFDEDTPYAPRPDNLYAVSKAEADHVVLDFMKKSKMGITISNCSNNYGPFQYPEKLIPVVVTNLIDKIKVPVHGDGLNVRDWIHTEDHSSAIDLILKKGNAGETYLIGSNNDWSNAEIAEKIIDLFGLDPEKWIRYVPNRHSNDRRYAIDSKKIQKELGWRPKYTRANFEDGLKEVIGWYKKNEDWWRPLLEKRAELKDEKNKVIAYMTLDRELGRTIVDLKSKNGVIKKKNGGLVKDEKKIEMVLKKLKSKVWYKKSSEKVKEKIKELADNERTIGFIDDIANRPDKIGNAKQLRITKISHSLKGEKIYGVAVWFEVEEAGEKREEGYYSWGMGPKSGAKILVQVKNGRNVSHIAILKKDKFAMGEEVFDSVGGFPLFGESIRDLISRKLYGELGLDLSDPKVKLEELVGLGRIMPDAGMTNNHPLLYSVTLKLDKSVFPSMKRGQVCHEDGIVLWPVDKLEELINKVDDAYFLSSISRLYIGMKK